MMLKFFAKRRFIEPEVELKKLADQLSKALGGSLDCVMVYGSFASGEYDPQRSDLNVLVILKDVSYQTLKSIGPTIRQWIKKGQPEPVIFQSDELALYAQHLPIEFLDLLENHHMVLGKDPLVGMSVSEVHLREQCLYELALKQLRLRQAVAATADHPKELGRLLEKSFHSVLAILRAGLRTREKVAKTTKLQSAQKLAASLGLEAGVLETLDRERVRRKTDDMSEIATDYMNLLEKVFMKLGGGSTSL